LSTITTPKAHTTSCVAPHSLFKKLILEPPLIKHIPLALLHHKQDHRVVLAIRLPALGETRRDLPERLVRGISIEVGEVRGGTKVLVSLLGEVPESTGQRGHERRRFKIPRMERIHTTRDRITATSRRW
jgi:hypothetical protein